MDKQGFDFHNWATKLHLTPKTMSVLIAEEVDNLPALLLLEERDLHELFLPLGQRKLLLNAIGWLQNKRNTVGRRDNIGEMYSATAATAPSSPHVVGRRDNIDEMYSATTAAPTYTCKRTKYSPASSPASSYSYSKTKSCTDESLCSYNEEENNGASEVEIEEQINTIIEEQFNTIMLVQSKKNGHQPIADLSNDDNNDDNNEDVFVFNDVYQEISRDELSEHVTVEKVFECKESADEEGTIENCCELDREISMGTSATDSDHSHSDTPSGRHRRNLPRLPAIKLPIKDNESGMKHTVTLRLDFKSMPD